MTRGATPPAPPGRGDNSRLDFRPSLAEIKLPRLSLRERIDMMCKLCIYTASGGGGWRQQVSRCASCSCPLWPVRPRPELRSRT